MTGTRPMLAVSILNSQVVYDGVIQGLAIAVIAVGVVLVYRATRIINFAVGNIGVVGATTLSLLVLQYHVRSGSPCSSPSSSGLPSVRPSR